uniref:Laminin subunit alpha-5 n=1 Tax=Oncorhynchus kisutch TaxID=8019 RepID=A0A8C7JXD6_ONCKI
MARGLVLGTVSPAAGGPTQLALLLLYPLICGLSAQGQELPTNGVNGYSLHPPYFNLAEGTKITATATCGEGDNGRSIHDLYCKLVGGPVSGDPSHQSQTIQGQYCDTCAIGDSDRAHPISNAIDGTERWWQSPPLSRSTEFNQVNVTLDLGQLFHVAYVLIKFANSPRPDLWVLERSTDFGETYQPWQFFASSKRDCIERFGQRTIERINSDNDVICTTEYSRIVPLENGEVVVSLVNGRPGAMNFSYSPVLRDFTKATNIRLRFLRTNTLLGHLMGKALRDPTVTRRYYYSIKDISIGGRCVCNGHAEACDPHDPNDPYKLQCDCQHNTCGTSCDQCCPGYNQIPWKPATTYQANEFCMECQVLLLFGCYYDPEVDQRRASINVQGQYRGGGVCMECQHHTAGVNCERCVLTYYRSPDHPLDSPLACSPCVCQSEFTDGTCEDLTGRCYCKPNYTGENCDSCAEGYINFPDCYPNDLNNNTDREVKPAGEIINCECSAAGTEGNSCRPDPRTRTCICKPGFTGDHCDSCAPGHYGLNCQTCQCFGPGCHDGRCDLLTGQCLCRQGFQGYSCDQCTPGYFNYPLCQLCGCSSVGSLPGGCDVSGQCVCRPEFQGPRCEQCRSGFHSYPNCQECTCDPRTSLGSSCSVSGHCHCRPNYSGTACEQCAPGFYGFPSCTPCQCSAEGSRFSSCDQVSGQCTCLPNVVGQRCDTCSSGTYRFPLCQAGTCNPAGSVQNEVLPTGSCECRPYVEGVACDRCKPLFWNLSPDTVYRCSRTVAGVAECNNGQCHCKPNVCSGTCSVCKDGYFNLQSGSFFGCQGCQCDIGGSVGQSCGERTGRCRCRPNVEGSKCNMPRPDHYFPDLHHLKFEIEEGTMLDGRPVRFGYNPLEFEGFSWRGYAQMSSIQSKVVVQVSVSSPDLFQIVLRYVNRGGLDMRGRVSVLEDGKNFMCGNCKCKTLYYPALSALYREKVQWDTAFLSPAFLSPAFLSPASPPLLFQLCCSPFAPPPLHKVYLVPREQFIMDYLETKVHCIMYSGRVQTLGRYVFILHYHQPLHPTYPVQVFINGGRIWQGHANASFCPHGYGCRSVLISENQIILDVTDNEIFLTVQVPDGKTLWLDYVLVVPESSYSSSYLSEQPLDKSYDFISNCGQNSFYINPATASPFCRSSAISLSAFFNNGAMPCGCHEVGADSDTCQPFGGQCQCRPNVIGRDCSQCATGYWGFPNCRPCQCATRLCEPVTGDCICPPRTLLPECIQCEPQTFGCHPLVGCEVCNCSRPGVTALDVSCDTDSGQCRCKNNIIGRQCDRCSPGFYGYPNCRPCDCNEAGTEEEVCDSSVGRCLCKENVQGGRCDQCRVGTFHLDPTNPKGCTSCFCFGATNRCRSSEKRRTEVMDMMDWVLLGADRQEVPVTVYPDQDLVEADLSDVPDVYQDLFWHAPRTYLGDKVSSYGGYLRYRLHTQTMRGDVLSLPTEASRPDIILKVNNPTQCTLSFTSEQITKIFRHAQTGNMVSREELMMVLVGLESLQIRALHSQSAHTVSLRGVVLEGAQTLSTGQHANNVEICLCPANYQGDSCQQCSPGYYRDTKGLFLGKCVPCNCNGHSDQCLDGSGVCENCQHNRAGDHCEKCQGGFLGNHSLDGQAQSCDTCPCPLQVASNNFAVSCVEKPNRMLCLCMPGYAGPQCARCAPGFYGNPMVIGSTCQPCHCHDNTDPNMLFSDCDGLTGECHSCMHNTAGTHCEICNCTRCNCSPCGTASCDPHTGQCQCKPGVTGPQCNCCEDGAFGYESCSGCRRCDCDAAAALVQPCDPRNGSCACQPGVNGPNCRQCAPGYWDYSPEGCKKCECKHGRCDPRTGECRCGDGLTGKQCDSCSHRYSVPVQHGHDMTCQRKCVSLPLVLAKVKDQLVSRVVDNEGLVKNIREHLGKFHDQLMDLRDALNQAVNNTALASDTNAVNEKRLEDCQHKVVEDLLQMAEDDVATVNDMLSMLHDSKEEYERLAAQLDGARMPLAEKVQTFAPTLIDGGVISNTNKDGFIQRAVNASRAYSDIIDAVRDAETAANQAAVDALETIVVNKSRSSSYTRETAKVIEEAKAAAEEANSTAAKVEDTLAPIKEQLDQWQQQYGDANTTNEDINKAFLEANKSGKSTTTTLVRPLDTEWTTDVFNFLFSPCQVSVPVKFNGTSGVQVRTPSNLADLAAYTSLKFYITLPEASRARRQDQPDKQFVFYLGNKDVNIFYFLLSNSYGDFNNVVLERILQYGQMAMSSELSEARMTKAVVEAGGDSGLLNLQTEETVFYVGGYPDTFTVRGTPVAHLKGCIELETLNEEVLSLYNFENIFQLNTTEEKPCGSSSKGSPTGTWVNDAAYFDGTGYAQVTFKEDAGKMQRFEQEVKLISHNGILLMLLSQVRGHATAAGLEIIILLYDTTTRVVVRNNRQILFIYVFTTPLPRFEGSYYLAGVPEDKMPESLKVLFPRQGSLKGCFRNIKAMNSHIDLKRMSSSGVSYGCANDLLFLNNGGFVGCVRDLELNEESPASPSASLGVVPCFQTALQPGAYFSSQGGLMAIDESLMLGRDLEVQLEVRPVSDSGLLLHAGSRAGQQLSLYLYQGAVTVTVNRGSGEFYTSFTPEESLCDGRWHSIKSDNVLQLHVDTASEHSVGPKQGRPSGAKEAVYLGGAPGERPPPPPASCLFTRS